MLPLIDNIYLQSFATILVLVVVVCVLLKLAISYQQLQRAQNSVIDEINRVLPQTQCGQCSYKGCRPYARAIYEGEAINKCPPGGSTTIRMLARILNETPRGLDPAHGQLGPILKAVIREDECIGCTKCIQACPVDAILGGAKLMHTVIARECTGCDLCVEPCPVDCIDMVLPDTASSFSWPLPEKNKPTENLLKASL
ncbi:MAG: electron transport complex subunit RsxB [SAR86 cluster bacterium]|uniref:Electron transport complex subunit RsxB n=1 Tax=SAR86 cluster bacterium TaxID=2030880 RepID=A0A2A5AW90_9GAMM|nr:MAG: electron transport complex subunit RsxB [SAR86 cluster bacterium]